MKRNTANRASAQMFTPDLKAIKQALAERFEDAGRECVQLVSIRLECDTPRCRKHGTCRTHAETFEPGEINDAAEWAFAENQRPANVYVSLATPMEGLGKKASKEELALLHCVHFDYDLPKRVMTEAERERWKRAALDKLTTDLPDGVPEGFEVVDSGGGFNVIWPLADAMPATSENIDIVEGINKRLAAAFGADGASEWNADRVLRLAGTVNWPTTTKLARGRVPALSSLVYTAKKPFRRKNFAAVPELSTSKRRASKAVGTGKRYDRLSISENWTETFYEDAVDAYPRVGTWKEDQNKDGSENLNSLLWTWIHAMCQTRQQSVADMDCEDARINLYRLVDDQLYEGGDARFPAIYAHLEKSENVRGWEGKLCRDIDKAFTATVAEGIGPAGAMRQARAENLLERLRSIRESREDMAGREAEFIAKIAAARLTATLDAQCIEELAAMHGIDAKSSTLTKDLAAEQKRLKKVAKEKLKLSLADDDVDAGDATDLSEEWFAMRFADRHKDRLRYVANSSQWFEWTGTHWQKEDTLNVYDLIRIDIRAAARKLGTDDEGLARMLNSQATRAAVEKLAKSDRRLVATQDQWDKDAWLLNTPGGVVNLRTGELLPHDPARYMSKIAAVTPGGECTRWLRFLDQVTNGDEQLQRYLQKFCGYSLTGDVAGHLLHFFHGPGRNGKGVFVNTIRGMMGDYATAAAMDTFVERRNASHPTELAYLMGARFVTVPEVEEGVSWNESRVKAFTGGDPVTARFMRGDFFQYEPTFKLAIVGNHKPRIKNVDVAMAERLRLIPFSVTIPKAERDPDLTDKLRDEWPGILQWAIDGCVTYRKEGLTPPKVVKIATNDYLDAQDTHAQWFADRCEEAPTSTGTYLKDLFADWKDYAETNRLYAGNSTALGERMEAMGCKRITKKNRPFFLGVRVNPNVGARR